MGEKPLEAYRKLLVSTGDRTPLEYLSPVAERNSKGARSADILVSAPLVDFCAELLRVAPSGSDPFLALVDLPERSQVIAGLNYSGYETYRRLGPPAPKGASDNSARAMYRKRKE